MADPSVFSAAASRRPLSLFTALFTVLLCAGCAALPPGAAGPPPGPTGRISAAWEYLDEGVEIARSGQSSPPVQVYCLRVDTENPAVRVIITPCSGTSAGEFPGSRTSSFLEQYSLTAAVNGSPFQPVVLNEGHPTDVVGVSISEGTVCSPPEPDYDCLVRDESGSYRIMPQDEIPENTRAAIGGFRQVLKKGKAVGAAGPRHPRTGVGIDASGRYLYLMVIDGRNRFRSIGATEQELALWLMRFGAYDGLNLDGGGSAAMVIADESGAAEIVNSPIGYGRLNMERVVGNHIGIQTKY